jgi:hypothetical protein
VKQTHEVRRETVEDVQNVEDGEVVGWVPSTTERRADVAMRDL